MGVVGTAILSGPYSCLAAAAQTTPQTTLVVTTTTTHAGTLISKGGTTLKAKVKIAQTSTHPSDYPGKSMTAELETSGSNACPVAVLQIFERWLATEPLLEPTTSVWPYSPSPTWPPSTRLHPAAYFSADPSLSSPHPVPPYISFAYSSSKINTQ